MDTTTAKSVEEQLGIGMAIQMALMDHQFHHQMIFMLKVSV